ncbi:CPBP family glutamic-type intramembrane protease [Crocinitomicaceae bacterium]|nr:CPBP family glutamic-type intramembrane protease [Crocinitomicaceae bacterium]
MKKQMLRFGWITLLLFPIPGYLIVYFTKNSSFLEFIDVQSYSIINLVLGLELGVVYGFISYLFIKAPFFKKLPNRIDHLVQQMELKVSHGIFLSLCAGIGEELLFRGGIQPVLGPFVTSILFVGLHGYLNPLNLRFSVYGLIVLPFIFLISYGLEPFGLLFCIGAHFSYDAILFTFMIKEN